MHLYKRRVCCRILIILVSNLGILMEVLPLKQNACEDAMCVKSDEYHAEYLSLSPHF